MIVRCVACAVIATVLAGCTGPSPSGPSPAMTISGPRPAGKPSVHLDTTEMIFFPGTDAALLPLGIDDGPFGSSKTIVKASIVGGFIKIHGAGGGYERQDQRTGKWSNAIVVDRKSGAGRLLLDRPALLTHILWTSAAEENRHQLFVLADRDTDGDGKISDDDAATLWHATLPAGQLLQITPAGTNLEEIVRDSSSPSSAVLYLKYRIDTDKDGKFEESDQLMWSRFDPAKPAMSTPLWQDDLPNKAREMILQK